MPRSTFQTAMSLCTAMIGSAIVVFPLNYLNEGIIENLIFLFIMGPILCFTCCIYAKNLRHDQKDITESIKRIVGEKHFKMASVLCGVEVFFVSCICFLLSSDILYDSVLALNRGPIFLTQIEFKFLILTFYAKLTILNDLKYVFKLSPFAFGSLVLSTLILIGSFPLNIHNLNVGTIQFKQGTLYGFLTVASVNGFAFTVHPSISPIIKAHKDQQNNQKAVVLGFFLTMILYLCVGTAGCLAIYNLKATDSDTVMDYFVGKWQAPAIGLSSVLYFLMVFPIFNFVSKSQITGLFSQETRRRASFRRYVRYGYLIIWVGVNSGFTAIDINPEIVMSFIGSVVSSYFVYFLPVLIIYTQRGLFKKKEVQIKETEISDSISCRADGTGVLDSNRMSNKNLIQKPYAVKQTVVLVKEELIDKAQHNQSASTPFGRNTPFKQGSSDLSQRKSKFNPMEEEDGSDIDRISRQVNEKQSTEQQSNPLGLPKTIGYGSIVLVGVTLFVTDIITLTQDF